MKNMKIVWLIAVVAFAIPAFADTYRGKPGSSVKIIGTSNIHDWTVESRLIGGSMELNGDLNKKGKVDATVTALISVVSLKSDKKAMDDIMHAAMKAEEHRRVEFKLKDLIAEGDMKFKATGDLSLAGVTKEVSFPVSMEKVDADKLKVKGELDTKMTDFGITPPAPSAAGGLIKTADDVKVVFEWMTQKK